jgi:hypothetical protein
VGYLVGVNEQHKLEDARLRKSDRTYPQVKVYHRETVWESDRVLGGIDFLLP